MATDIEMLIRARNEAQAALQSVQNDLKQIDSASKSVGQSFKDAGKDIAKLGVGLSASVTAPVAALGTAAVMSAADFEQSMSVLAQVTGASTSAMAQMQAQALQLGAETSFSAGEAAAAMLELGKAGLDTVQISESIGGVLDLAAAGNLGLAEAAEIAANAVNAFGLDASQSTQVANMLAAAANASSVDVIDLAAAFRMSASVFAVNGQSIQDMTTALAILGNNAIKGSDAGTSLKTMLMRLTAPTAEAAAVMTELGIKVYDASGTMLEMPAILTQMSAATGRLTDEQRNAALTTIFGADAIRAANILLEAGSEQWSAMSEAVNQGGAAAEVANARMSGVNGAVEYFKGTLESTLIEAVLPYMDGISQMIRQAADFIGQFSQIPPNIRNVIVVVSAAAAALGPLLVGIGMVASAIGAALPVIGSLGGALALLSNPIGWVIAGVAALAAAFATDFGGIRTAVMSIVEPLTWFVAAVQEAGINSIEASEAFSAFPQPIQNMVAALQAAWTQLDTFLAPAIARLQAAFAGAQGALSELSPKFAELNAALVALWTAAEPILAALAQAIGVALAVAMDLGLNLLIATIQNLPAIIGPIIDQVTASIRLIATVLSETVTLVTAILSGDWATAWASAQTILTAFSDFYLATWENLTAVMGALLATAAETVTGALSDMGVDVKGVMDGITGWWSGTWQGLKSVVQPVIDIVQAFREGMENLAGYLGGLSLPNPFANWSMPELPSLPNFSLPGFGQGGVSLPGYGAPTAGGRQLGTNYWPGGLTWVGEMGPELVSLPRGAAVLPNREATAVAGAAAGGNWTFNLYGNVRGEDDLLRLAYEVADIIGRRR